MTIMYHDGNRRLQDEFQSRRIADRLEEKLTRKRALPFMLDAHRKVWAADIGMNRFIGRTRT